MKKILRYLALTALIFGSLNAAQYELDKPHTNIGFIVKHLKISKVNGNFSKYTATINYDKETNELLSFEADIDARSINTNSEARDRYLKETDFLDTDNFTNIKFKMTKFQRDSDKDGKIYGALTIKDITKPLILDFKYNGESKNKKGSTVIGMSLEGEISRKNFKVGDNYPDVSISEKIQLNIEIEAILK
ncbi:MAG: YceI family protein [Campylobacter sp.]